jgi:hypothetical protein
MDTRSYHLVDSKEEPFFWLADTAWNLWCKGTPDEWDEYLSVRRAQGFNTVQFVAGWWRGAMQPIHGRPFDVDRDRISFDESAMESLDLLFAKIRAAGLVAAPVMLWTLTDIDPGQVLTEEQCIEVARTQLSRWRDPNVVWLLGGDGNYTSPSAQERWKRIGRAVFGESTADIATLHPCGVTWVADSFSSEPWYKIATIQSGHGSREADLRFLVDGEYAHSWPSMEMPFINLEPNYEDARSYHERKHLTAYHVRRASYWSLLVAPPAGVTYGIGSIWMWARNHGEIAENHSDSWAGRPWNEDLYTPGAESMSVLKGIFERLPWTELRPTPELLRSQPGHSNVEDWQAVAATSDHSCLVAYAPTGGRLDLNLKGVPPSSTVYHVDTESGHWDRKGTAADIGRATSFPRSQDKDRLLVVLQEE